MCDPGGQKHLDEMAGKAHQAKTRRAERKLKARVDRQGLFFTSVRIALDLPLPGASDEEDLAIEPETSKVGAAMAIAEGMNEAACRTLVRFICSKCANAIVSFGNCGLQFV